MGLRARLIRAGDCRRTRWKNDGGWTTEIASAPAPKPDEAIAANFRWRVSIAEIEHDGPFSNFAGVDRDLLLLAGTGIELDIDDAPPVRLHRRFQHVHFAGEQRVQCRLLAGATRDFNVMVRRAEVRAEVVARPLTGSMVIFPAAQATWLIHVFAGHARARAGGSEIVAAISETMLFEDDPIARERIVLDGSGELVLVKLVDTANVPAPQLP